MLSELQSVIDNLKSEGHIDREKYKKIKTLIENAFTSGAATEIPFSSQSTKENIERDLFVKEKTEFQVRLFIIPIN